jgi:hypothetical protein
VLVMANLNTHSPASFYEVFPPVNAGVILRRNNFDPLLIFSPRMTTYRVLRSVCAATRVNQRCGPPPAKGASPPGHTVVDGFCRDERTRGIPQSHLRARLVCQAYHRHPGRTRLSPPLPRLAHSRCPQSRAAPPQVRRSLLLPNESRLSPQGESTPTPMWLAPAYF